jgi:2-dehydro-3-deoxyphosphogluconate aldolase/(4S)-4-hydroxy-2-oxoglutarate aldolase
MPLVRSLLKTKKIIAIVRNVPSEKIIATVQALLAGGMNAIEITINQKSVEDVLKSIENIRLIRKTFGDRICLGAGTVMTIEQADAVIEAGAEYIISPHTDEALIQHCKMRNVITIPGALTPTEIVKAYTAGADFVKVFPSNNFGLDYLKALKAPLDHIPLVAVGGVDLENIDSYLKMNLLVGIGSNLVDLSAISKNDFASITLTAKAYVEKINRK